MNSTQAIRAAFARGFFHFLEARGIASVVLHGGDDGFEGGISDVDFAVGHEHIHRLEDQIRAYCLETGWRLCQILPHETTAAYHVCSSHEYPEIVVALDACSHYQRMGMNFLDAGEMLEHRRTLSWGGYGLQSGWELRYRFAKAAAKGKNAGKAAEEFANYSREDILACSDWLASRWGIAPVDWTAVGLERAFAALLHGADRGRKRFDVDSLRRIIRRLLRPTGLVVEHGDCLAFEELNSFAALAGSRYFRRQRVAPGWESHFLRDLVASTLILVPKVPRFWRLLLPSDCILRVPSLEATPVLFERLARHLQERCLSRKAKA